jgi:hypothetical protein
MNELYREFAGEGGDMLSSVVVKLANPDPPIESTAPHYH